MVIEDLHSGTQRHLMGHAEEISTLALQHDGLFLASASGPSDINSSQICLWNIQEGVCKKVNNFNILDERQGDNPLISCCFISLF